MVNHIFVELLHTSNASYLEVASAPLCILRKRRGQTADMYLLGLLFMMSLSGGLKPRAVAGRPSVTRLTHSSCTGFKISGNPAQIGHNVKIAEQSPQP